jgi:DNA repair exonuclease SbcCD ATPase subunit
LTALGIPEEVADKIVALHTEEMRGLIPETQLTELTVQLENANSALSERDKQLTELKKSVGDNEELKSKITALQEDNKTQKAEYEEKIRNIRIDNAIESALTKAGARNIKAARALLNTENINLDEKGEVVGLDEQVQALTGGEDTGFLFVSNNAQGYVPGQGDNIAEADTRNMNYTELCAYMEANPDAKI